MGEAQEKRYVASFVTTPPVIDGKLTSLDEWRQASTGGDGWTVLKSPGNQAEDPTNNRFAAVWDNDGLYLLHEVDHDQWAKDGIGGINFLYENVNFFFDPNTDHESNDQTAADDTGIDGYQLAFNQPEGSSVISPSDVTAGVFREAHVNALFGDQGAPWSGFENIVMRQTTSNEAKKGYTELFIPWNQFDATDPEDGFNPSFGDDIGLFHPEPPVDGEEWFFNVARIQSNGVWPVWAVSGPNAIYFAARPHGIIEFKMSDIFTPSCDINGDTACDALDIDDLSLAVRTGKTEAKYDLDGNGQVTDGDRLVWIKNPAYMNTYVGDSTLEDRQFSSSDLVLVFIAGEYEDGIAGNSGWAEGDWNGDADFTSADFVAAFTDGGYELGPRPAMTAVPEPSSAFPLLLGIVWLLSRRRRAS
jgi:hypothetical protein